MQIHDLGPLWIESGGVTLSLHGRRMTTALSVLAVDLGGKVRSDALIDAVWGREPSPNAEAALDTLMWRLRRVLDPDRLPRAPSTVLRTMDDGYRLMLPDASIDSRQFVAAADRIEALRNSGDDGGVLAASAQALALWRGRPYDDVEGDDWLQTYRMRLMEHHLAVQQSRALALLDLGQPERAVADLVPAVAEHPFVEKLWEYRMLGLYQAGRSSAALETYSEIAALLDRELGTSPGPELRQLRQRILQQDPVLSRPRERHMDPVIMRIPRPRTSLVGRSGDLDAVEALLQQHRLVSITGPVGCGKTRLATATADRVQQRFPDGVCFVDLTDVAAGSEVADRVQETLHIDGGEQPATRTIAEFLGDREFLLVLDNCEQVSEAAAAMVGAILDAGPSAYILVTTRKRLGLEDECGYALQPLPLPAEDTVAGLRTSPAVRLLASRAATHGITLDLEGADGALVATICQATDGLPLTIELAASRLRIFRLHEIADIVSESPISLGDPAIMGKRGHHEATLRDSIEWSHRMLADRDRAVYRRLSVLPPSFTLEAALAACGFADVSAEAVPNALVALVDNSLLQVTKAEREDGPSVFRQLVPIRAHAAATLADSGEGATAAESLLRWIVDTAAAGPRLGQSDHGRWDRHLHDNRRTITAALESAILTGPSDDVLITLARLVPYWWLGGSLGPETERLISAASKGAGPGNSEFAAAAVTAAHGAFRTVSHRGPGEPGALVKAIDQLAGAPDALATFAADFLLAIAATCWIGGDLDSAEAAADGVAGYGERLDDDHARVLSRALRCAMGVLSKPSRSEATARSVLTQSRDVGNAGAEIMCLHTLYTAALIQQDATSGLEWNAEALRCQQGIGQRNAAPTLEARGSLYVLSDSPRDAARCYGAANLQYSRQGSTWQLPGTTELVTTIRARLTPDEFDEAWQAGERLAAGDLPWV